MAFSLLVDPPGLELIYTFKLAFTLDTSDPSRATQASRLWTPSDRPEQLKRPEHPYRPEQLKRPESGRSDTGQNNLSVKNLDALLGSNCVVF